jgi:DNA ligase-1
LLITVNLVIYSIYDWLMTTISTQNQRLFGRRLFNFRLISVMAGFASLTQLPAASAKTSASPKDLVLLAKNAPSGIDPEGYLVSEKLDGVRAVWDGKALRFRSGRVVAAPAWFTAKLPKIALDGELWLGRGQFDVLSGMVRKVKPVDADWQQVKYMVFELPQDKAKFAERAVKLKSIVQDANFAQLQAVDQFNIANRATLQAKLDDVVQSGGEGLMLHLASSLVEVGRSDVLLKLKPVQDAEAVVVGYEAGKGKYKGMTGALEVKTADGQRFKIGTGLSDEQRKRPPAIGSTIIYSYRDLTPSGKPRFASFLRVFDLN